MLFENQVYMAWFVENVEIFFEYKMSHNNEEIKILKINFW